MESIFLTDREAADILRVNVRHVRRMVKAGLLRGKDVSVGSGKHKILRIYMEDVVGYKKPTK